MCWIISLSGLSYIRRCFLDGGPPFFYFYTSSGENWLDSVAVYTHSLQGAVLNPPAAPEDDEESRKDPEGLNSELQLRLLDPLVEDVASVSNTKMEAPASCPLL